MLTLTQCKNILKQLEPCYRKEIRACIRIHGMSFNEVLTIFNSRLEKQARAPRSVYISCQKELAGLTHANEQLQNLLSLCLFDLNAVVKIKPAVIKCIQEAQDALSNIGRQILG